jgi:mutator protein MutT
MAGLILPCRRQPLVGRPVVDVAVGVLRSPDGRVLLAERKPGKDAAGFWEVPGGQVEPGESAAQAAARELHEEVGVRALEVAPWRVYEHDFPAKRVRLHWFHVRRWSGEPKGREGQRLAWVDPASPTVGPLLPSNELALVTLALPDLVAVARVDRAQGSSGELLARIPSLAAGGLRLLIVCGHRSSRLPSASSSPAGCASCGGVPGCASSCPGRRWRLARPVPAGCTAPPPRWPA